MKLPDDLRKIYLNGGLDQHPSFVFKEEELQALLRETASSAFAHAFNAGRCGGMQCFSNSEKEIKEAFTDYWDKEE